MRDDEGGEFETGHAPRTLMDAEGRFSDSSPSFFRPHEGRAIVPNPKRSKSPRDSCSLAPEHLNALDFNRPNRGARLFLRKLK